MYNEYFGLKESPFSIAPDPRYLYMSDQHREALAHLIYGFNSDGGFVLLTGEVGTGKTTVCRCLLEQIPDNTSIAFILNPKLTAEELLATICDEFGIKYPEGNASIKVFTDLINAYLLGSNAGDHKAVLIIDEAQNLSSDVLEQLRLLTNLETNKRKLLQIILLGQPELRDKLSRPELRQLSQRIIARYHLGSLSRKEVESYISHRLSIAGLREKIFPDSTIDKIYRYSEGVPRLINVLCDRAMLGTYTQGKRKVGKGTLRRAAGEVFGDNRADKTRRRAAIWVLPVIVLMIVGVVLAATYYKEEVRQAFALSLLYKAAQPDPADTGPETAEPMDSIARGWPDEGSSGLNDAAAFQALFSLWGIEYINDGSVSFCEQAKAHGLQCISSIGSMNNLSQINRPAILKLYGDEGSEYYAVLKYLKEDSAGVLAGSEIREVAYSDIESRWQGEYTVLWKVPADYSGNIYAGAENILVPWIDNQLASIQGRPAAGARKDMIFDDDLVGQVKRFQMSEGLVPDGIIGTHTIMKINSLTDGSIPKLKR